MYGALDVSTSGMVAQRIRLEAIAGNLANKGTILDADGNLSPYKRRIPVFAPGDPSASTRAGKTMGVHVASIELDNAPPVPKYEPTNMYADEDGYIYVPNIDPVTEQMNAMLASRAYEANVVAAEATKSMVAQALRLIA